MGGKVKDPGTHQSWLDMKQRCFNPRHRQFKNYGARGITVCERWKSFKNFIDDMGSRPPGLTIDRKDNDGNYEPSNCRWATRAEQRRNQRGCIHLEYNGKKMTIQEWSRELGLDDMAIRLRYRQGLPIAAVLSPIRHKHGELKARGSQ